MKLRSHDTMKCSSRQRVTAGLLLSFLAFSPPTSAIQSPLQHPLASITPTASSQSHVFSLKHIFHRGTYRDPDLHKRFDVQSDTTFFAARGDDEELVQIESPPVLTAQSNSIQIERLVDRQYSSIEEHLQFANYFGHPRILDQSYWTLDEIPGPNTTDKETVVNLAIMAGDAYVPNVGEGEWRDVSNKYNNSVKFGWEGDGLRGHIFSDERNETVIVSLKGTSPAVFDGDGTTTRDKLNDNLLFSCCCGQGGQLFWRQVCDCATGTYTCNSTCLVTSLKQKTRYYSAAIDLYQNVTALYPNSNVWIVGHSLGGSVSSLLGLTFGLPVVTFEAPGDALAAGRLGLPAPSTANPNKPYQRKYSGAVHFGHTADPVFMGSCNGVTSPCTLGGYAMESQCHTGTQCVYDTVADYGWRVGLGYHRIWHIIDNVLKKYDHVAKCELDTECWDCFNWKYFKSNGSERTTTSTSSQPKTSTSTLTRTTTCKTPGWWGCLDPTGTTSSTPVATITYTTTTCLTPGWFGCNVEGNTTVTTTTAISTKPTSVHATTTLSTTSSSSGAHISSSSSVPSTSCKTPGWFGCYDRTTTMHTKSHTSIVTTTAWSTVTRTGGKPQSSCETPGLFFGCWDEPTSGHPHRHSSTITSKPTVTSIPTSTTTMTSTSTRKGDDDKKCKHRVFFGLICVDHSKTEGESQSLDEENTSQWQTEL